MDKERQTPRNQAGQKPTRDAEETQERLEEKARSMKGEADRLRTEEQIDEVRSSARNSPG